MDFWQCDHEYKEVKERRVGRHTVSRGMEGAWEVVLELDLDDGIYQKKKVWRDYEFIDFSAHLELDLKLGIPSGRFCTVQCMAS